MTDLTLLPPAEAASSALITPAELIDPGFLVEFAGQLCASLDALALAMAENWDAARKALLSGSLTRSLDSADLSAAAVCREEAASVSAGRITPDRGTLNAIRRLSGQPLTVWCGRRYADPADLGGSILAALRGTGAIPAHLDGLLESGAASLLAEEAQRPGLAALESRYAAPDCALREKTLLMYMAGFLLAGVPAFVMEGETFYTVEELAAFLRGKAKRPAVFTRLCHRLMDADNLLDPQLEAWLTAIGRRQDVKKWQTEIDAGML